MPLIPERDAIPYQDSTRTGFNVGDQRWAKEMPRIKNALDYFLNHLERTTRDFLNAIQLSKMNA